MADEKQAPELRVYEQIELSADYYPPSVYRVLSQYARMDIARDVDSDDFMPISPVAQRGVNPKIFAFGVMPPSSNVTGRLLDRSATVQASGLPTSQPETTVPTPGSGGGEVIVKPPAGKNKDPIVTAPGYQLKPATGTSAGVVPNGTPPGPDGGAATITKLSIPEIWGILYQAYSEMKGRPPTPQEMQFYVAQCVRETGGSIPDNNFGFVGNYDNYRKGTFKHTNGKYFERNETLLGGAKQFLGHLVGSDNVVQSAQEGDALAYATCVSQDGYFGEPINVYYGGAQNYKGQNYENAFPRILGDVSRAMSGYGVQLDDGRNLPKSAPDSCAFKEDVFQYRARLEKAKIPLTQGNLFRFRRDSVYNTDCPQGTTGSTSNWQQAGTDNASDARQTIDDTANRSLMQEDLTNRLTAAQSEMIKATKAALDAMAATPPLRMLVNPTSFKVTSEKVVNDGSYGRYGPIVEHWGDNQDKIDASGTVAGFWAVDISGKSQGPGLTRTARNASLAYQNFLSLYLLYRNNGGVWLGGPGQETLGLQQQTLSVLGSVYIYYDNTLYIGSFDTLSITESDDKPFSLEYNFGFTIRATFTLDNVDSVVINGRQANPFADTSSASSVAGPVALDTTSDTTTPTDPVMAVISSVELPPLPDGIAAEALATESTLGFGTGKGVTTFESSGLGGSAPSLALTPPKTGKGSK